MGLCQMLPYSEIFLHKKQTKNIYLFVYIYIALIHM